MLAVKKEAHKMFKQGVWPVFSLNIFLCPILKISDIHDNPDLHFRLWLNAHFISSFC